MLGFPTFSKAFLQSSAFKVTASFFLSQHYNQNLDSNGQPP